MDSITQGLLGATIAEAAFRKKLGGRSVGWAALAAVAPDFDMVAALAGEWQGVVHHRGVSHSWIVETAVAPLLGWLAWRFVGARRGSWMTWAHLTWWALVTHPALDLCTAYGTQLLAPFSTHRFAIDAVSIVDLAYSVPLLVAVIWSWRGRDRDRSRRVAIGALALTTAYLAFGYAQSQRAIAWANEELAAQGFEAVETRGLPSLGNLFVYRVAARDGEGRFRVAIVSLSAPRPLVWHEAADDDDRLVEVAMESERGRIMEWSSMGYACADLDHADDGGFVVHIDDLRYGSMVDPLRAMWGADARFDADGRLLDVVRWQARDELDMRLEMATLWAYLVGDPLPAAAVARGGGEHTSPACTPPAWTAPRSLPSGAPSATPPPCGDAPSARACASSSSSTSPPSTAARCARPCTAPGRAPSGSTATRSRRREAARSRSRTSTRAPSSRSVTRS